MRKPKLRVQQNLVTNCDFTFVQHQEVAARALRRAQGEHGCASGYGGLCEDADTDEPADAVHAMTQPVRKGALITRRCRVPKCGLLPQQAGLVVQRICEAQCHRAFALLEPLDWVLTTAYHSARTPGCVLRSQAGPAFLRTWASSFVSVPRRNMISLAAGGAHQPAGNVIVYVHAFLHLQRRVQDVRACDASSDEEDELAGVDR